MNSIVIARYNESLEWIVKIPPEFEIYIYNKGGKIVASHLLQKAHHIIDRPNTGRESETYLYHMLTNLKAGNGFTVFAQGDPFEHSPDFLQILANWREWDDLQPMTWQWRGNHGVPPHFILDDYQKRLQGHLRIRPERFSLATWAPSGFYDTGAFGTGRDYRMIHGNLPEGINIAAHFLRQCRLTALAEKAEAATFGVFCYGAIFAARNDLVRQIPVEGLNILRAASNGAATYGYILERIWLHLLGADFETTAPQNARNDGERQVPAAARALVVQKQGAEPASRVPTIEALPQNHERQDEHGIAIAQQALSAAASALKDVRRFVRPRRLFISTGYFATAVAAAVGSQRAAGNEDHLLIVIDRQDAEGNIRWAYHMFDHWDSVRVVTHAQYYGNKAGFRNPFGIEFDEVYSTHLTMAAFVEQKFPARRYFFYEEGMASYSYGEETRAVGARFYALSPKLMRKSAMLSSPVDVAALKKQFERSINCYQIPTFEQGNNVILLATGLPPDYAGSRSDTLTDCEPVARSLIAAGFTVWLRPHPRVSVQDIFENSSLAAEGVRILETVSPLIEPVILHNRERISAVISVYSSYLIHSYPLFGVPAFSLPATMLDEQQIRWKAIQDSFVPDIRFLLQSTSGDTSPADATFSGPDEYQDEVSYRRASS